MIKNAVQPIIKVNHLCNLSCKYCYYSGFNGRDKSRMTVSTAERIINETVKLNSANNHFESTFCWHGGEPTLNGLDFFGRIFEIQDGLIKKHGIKIKNLFQTNGILLDHEWMRLLKRANMFVGISVDGPKHINDLQRSHSDMVMKSIRLLQEHSVQFSVLTVIGNNHKNAKEIFDFYVENNIRSVGFCKEFSYSDLFCKQVTAVEIEMLKNFLIAFFDLYFDSSYELSIREFETAFRNIIGVSNGVCSMKKRALCGTFPSINPNGDVFFCSDFGMEKDDVLGNIYEAQLDLLLSSEIFRRIQEKTSVFPRNKCKKGCAVVEICGYGCPRHDVSLDGTVNNYFCETYKVLIDHIREKIVNYI